MSALVNRIMALPKRSVLHLAARTLQIPRPLVMFGEGSAQRLCNSMADQGLRRVLIVTDTVLAGLGLVAPLQSTLQERGVDTALFTGVLPDPTFAVVEEGIDAVRAHQADSILVLGGGSAIDAGKVMALSITTGKTPRQLVGVLKGRRPALPLFVLPSTSGTGSEVSIGAVISDSVTHVKSLIVDTNLIPLAAALDPLITRGMPAAITAETGADALTHALEGWVSGFANAQTDNYNRSALRLIFDHLETACREPHNLAARDAMALGSHYAGLCLSTSAVGYVHSIAHQLGAHYGIPHGRSNAMVLPHVLEFNRPVCEGKFARLSRELGFAGAGSTDGDATNALFEQVRALLSRLPLNLNGNSVRPEDYPVMARDALREAHGLYAVPRYMAKQDVIDVLERVRVA